MDASKALEQVRRDAVALADRRVRDMQRRLRADGAEDRAVLGIEEPAPAFNLFGWLGHLWRDMWSIR